MSFGHRIDAHAHQLPAAFLARVERHGHAYPLPGISTAEHLAAMDRYGWELAVVSLPPPGPHVGPPRLVRTLARCANEGWAELVRAHPGRFAALASLPLPDVDAALEEAAHALDVLGLDGVVLHTEVDGRTLADPAFAPLLEELDRRGAHVLLHPAETAEVPRDRCLSCLYELPFETTRVVVDLLYAGAFERWPRIAWQLSHAGGTIPFLAERIATLVQRAPAHAAAIAGDPVAQLRRLFYDTAQADSAPALAATLAFAPATQVVHGTDWPFAVLPGGEDPQPGLDLAGPQARAAIDRDNALRMAPALVRRLAATRPEETR